MGAAVTSNAAVAAADCCSSCSAVQGLFLNAMCFVRADQLRVSLVLQAKFVSSQITSVCRFGWCFCHFISLLESLAQSGLSNWHAWVLLAAWLTQ